MANGDRNNWVIVAYESESDMDSVYRLLADVTESAGRQAVLKMYSQDRLSARDALTYILERTGDALHEFTMSEAGDYVPWHQMTFEVFYIAVSEVLEYLGALSEPERLFADEVDYHNFMVISRRHRASHEAYVWLSTMDWVSFMGHVHRAKVVRVSPFTSEYWRGVLDALLGQYVKLQDRPRRG